MQQNYFPRLMRGPHGSDRERIVHYEELKYFPRLMRGPHGSFLLGAWGEVDGHLLPALDARASLKPPAPPPPYAANHYFPRLMRGPHGSGRRTRLSKSLPRYFPRLMRGPHGSRRRGSFKRPKIKYFPRLMRGPHGSKKS